MVKGVGERAERAASLPMVAVEVRDDTALDPNYWAELPATTVITSRDIILTFALARRLKST